MLFAIFAIFTLLMMPLRCRLLLLYAVRRYAAATLLLFYVDYAACAPLMLMRAAASLRDKRRAMRITP